MEKTLMNKSIVLLIALVVTACFASANWQYTFNSVPSAAIDPTPTVMATVYAPVDPTISPVAVDPTSNVVIITSASIDPTVSAVQMDPTISPSPIDLTPNTYSISITLNAQVDPVINSYAVVDPVITHFPTNPASVDPIFPNFLTAPVDPTFPQSNNAPLEPVIAPTSTSAPTNNLNSNSESNDDDDDDNGGNGRRINRNLPITNLAVTNDDGNSISLNNENNKSGFTRLMGAVIGYVGQTGAFAIIALLVILGASSVIVYQKRKTAVQKAK